MGETFGIMLILLLIWARIDTGVRRLDEILRRMKGDAIF
jgi:hypothetical protein